MKSIKYINKYCVTNIFIVYLHQLLWDSIKQFLCSVTKQYINNL